MVFGFKLLRLFVTVPCINTMFEEEATSGDGSIWTVDGSTRAFGWARRGES